MQLKHGVLTNTNNILPTVTNFDETEMEQEGNNKKNRETTPTQETVSKSKKATNNAQRKKINEFTLFFSRIGKRRQWNKLAGA